MINLALIPDEALVITTRLIVAVILCGFIGLEREIKGRYAGFRTHLLVGIGSCVMMILANFGFEEFLANHTAGNVRMDPSRLPSYVVSGIGFLGAGTIMVYGSTIRGLTTAASIWVVAGIGLVIGNGMYYTAFLVTLITVLSLLFLNRFEDSFIKSPKTEQLNIVVENKMVSLSKIIELVESENIKVRKVSVQDYPDSASSAYINYSLLIKYPDKKGLTTKIHDRLYNTDYIYKVFTRY